MHFAVAMVRERHFCTQLDTFDDHVCKGEPTIRKTGTKAYIGLCLYIPVRRRDARETWKEKKSSIDDCPCKGFPRDESLAMLREWVYRGFRSKERYQQLPLHAVRCATTAQSEDKLSAFLCLPPDVAIHY